MGGHGEDEHKGHGHGHGGHKNSGHIQLTTRENENDSDTVSPLHNVLDEDDEEDQGGERLYSRKTVRSDEM